MKKLLTIFTLLCMAVMTLCGCGINYDLPEKPLAFEEMTYVNPNDAQDQYDMIAYADRYFVFYGTLGSTIHQEDIKAVIGYKFRDEFPDDKNERVMSLTATNDYLMVYYVGREMEQPSFYRALDTQGNDIETPPYIQSLDYDIWKIN